MSTAEPAPNLEAIEQDAALEAASAPPTSVAASSTDVAPDGAAAASMTVAEVPETEADVGQSDAFFQYYLKNSAQAGKSQLDHDYLSNFCQVRVCRSEGR